jgi:hypothetical protein
LLLLPGMKKTTQTKLSLHREVIRQLADRELSAANGGGTDRCLMCPSKGWYTSGSRTIIREV